MNNRETGSDQPASGAASAIPATLVLAPTASRRLGQHFQLAL